MIVTTRLGDVSGTQREDGIHAFLGIPFAAPPVGPLRFEPPRPPTAWEGVRDATEYGPTAPHLLSTGALSAIIPDVVRPGDDYLNLNVWTADVTGSAPVMVFIHGGSFTSGSGGLAGYDGSRFARDGIVLVTINYRLGADGFLWFGDGAPNLGMLDQIAALEWVRDTIAAFGGDPASVTVFGESAGGMSVATLLAMPAAAGLFHRAIAESGAGHHSISADAARLLGTRLADILGVEPSRVAIATVPVPRLLDAQAQLARELTARPKPALWGDAAAKGLPFLPVVDGVVLPAAPVDAIVAGAGAEVDLLIGNNTEEAGLLLTPGNKIARMPRWLLYLVARQADVSSGGVRTYLRARRGARGADVLVSILTDYLYRIPAIRVAEAHPRAFVYEFGWGTPAFDGALGACHAVELPFVFDNLDHADWAGMTGGAAPQPVADAVHGAWVAFARTGDPGWERYAEPTRIARRFGTSDTTTSDDRAAERLVWSGIR
jgi:para-nitrobenzyl esterase